MRRRLLPFGDEWSIGVAVPVQRRNTSPNTDNYIPMLATRDPKFIRDGVIDKVVNQGVIVDGDADFLDRRKN